MEKATYKSLLIEHQNYLISKFNALQVIEFPTFHSLKIDCALLEDVEYYNELVRALKKNNVNDDSRIIYYFKVINGNSEKIQKEVADRKKFKRKSKKYIALPKVNTLKEGSLSNILYVGKTNSNFISRFKYHLGLSTNTTYALHLNGWAKDLNISVTLYYGVVSLNQDKIYLLEEMESILHNHLRPILGRSGH